MIDEVRERVDLVGVVSRHVTLRASGPRHWGLCPFHDEKTPSFSVHQERQIFYCFGCQAGGDVFGFVMRQTGLEFPDAVRLLAREAGVEVPEGQGESADTSRPVYRANELALAFFREELRNRAAEPARRYLQERGLSTELIERFQLGWAPARWDGLLGHLQRHGVERAAAERAGLIVRRDTGEGHYDRFRGRIVFPITEPSGRVLGFGGRVLGDDAPKYLNSAESPVYRKSRVLYALPLATEAVRAAGRVIVVEGYFDVVALHRAGLREVVAPCGTALTPEHARRLRRYAEQVVLLFDGDRAGQQAAERALAPLLAEGLRVRAAFLPDGQDPDDLLGRSGPEALRRCIDTAAPLLDALIDRALLKASDHAWDSADVARRVAPYLRVLPDPVERAAYLRQLAGRLNVPIPALERSLDAGRERRPARADAAEPTPEPVRPVQLEPAACDLIGALAAYPTTLAIAESLDLQWLGGDPARELLSALIAATRDRGEAALAQLLSPEAGLAPALQATLSQILLRHEPADAAAAERAARDCVAVLGRGALDRRMRELRSRLESCTDAAQVSALLEEQQQCMAQRRELWSRVQQV